MFVKVADNVYEYKLSGAGCLVAPVLIGWGVVRILHLTVFGLRFTAPATWVDWLILALGFASLFIPGKKLLTVDRAQRVVTVYSGPVLNPVTQAIPFDSIKQVKAHEAGVSPGQRRRAQEKHTSTRASLSFKLKDGSSVIIRSDAAGIESAVRHGWNIERLIGIGESETDEDGTPNSAETQKLLKSLDDFYRLRKLFLFRRGKA